MLSQEMLALGTARSAIRELFEYGKARAAEIGAENVFDFSLGNPAVPPPPTVGEALTQLLRKTDQVALHGYTSAAGDPSARRMLADDLNRRFGTDYTEENLYLTAGAAGALCCCFRALACPGDEFILIAPFFPEYQVFIAGAGARAVVVAPEPDTFQIDLAALEAAITPHTKGVVINSPNNPSGAVYSTQTIGDLAALLRRKTAQYGHPIYLISDEPYRELVFGGVSVPWVPHAYADTLVCYSFSKSLSVPGERIGYVLVPGGMTEPGVYAAVAGAGRSLGYVNAPALFQRVAAACCGQTADQTMYDENRRLLLDCLQACGFFCAEPHGAFYLFPRTLEPDAAAFCRRAMAHDLLLVPGDSFGCPGHARIAYCVPTERVLRALPALRALAGTYR